MFLLFLLATGVFETLIAIIQWATTPPTQAHVVTSLDVFTSMLLLVLLVVNFLMYRRKV